MITITFEIKSLLKLKVDLVDFPELTSPKKWIQKGIDILGRHTPRVLKYLSRQKILAELDLYHIRLETASAGESGKIKKVFRYWVRKERLKRMIYVIIEGIILPFTPILALLPGPNIFFYVPALLFYYHLRSYLGLKRVNVDDLSIEIVHADTNPGTAASG